MLDNKRHFSLFATGWRPHASENWRAEPGIASDYPLGIADKLLCHQRQSPAGSDQSGPWNAAGYVLCLVFARRAEPLGLLASLRA